MNSSIQTYVDAAIAEVVTPQCAVTKQYLEVNEVEYENGIPKLERVDLEFGTNLVAVYFPIKNEEYFLRVDVTKSPEIAVYFVHIENSHRTYLTATSSNLSFDELSQIIKLKPLKGWSKGDKRRNGKSEYEFSRISFDMFTSRAYSLETQLDLLLDELEKDADNIILLTQQSNAWISVHKYQYVSGNAGVGFDINTIKRLAKLNLSIDIDTYIVGTPLKDED